MVHEDNLSAISMAESLKFTSHKKYIAIKYHHFCSRVQTSFNKMGNIKLKYISTKQQLADIFIKPSMMIASSSFDIYVDGDINSSLFPRECENKAHMQWFLNS